MSAPFDLDALPADRLYAPEQDMWVQRQDDGTVLLGATHLIAQHGQFMYFSPRPVGTTVERDRSLGVMETAKTAIAIHTPLSGTIVAANDAVQQDVTLVMRDAYGAGWLFRLRPTAWDAERTALLDAAAYRDWLATRLDRFAPPVEDRPPDEFGRFY